MPEPAKSFIERRHHLAIEQAAEEAAERRRIEQLVLGANSRDQVTGLARLGDDYVVEVRAPDGGTAFTTVVKNKPTRIRWQAQEDSVLHLIARRYDDNPDTSARAVYYAGRVLGINEPAA